MFRSLVTEAISFHLPRNLYNIVLDYVSMGEMDVFTLNQLHFILKNFQKSIGQIKKRMASQSNTRKRNFSTEEFEEKLDNILGCKVNEENKKFFLMKDGWKEESAVDRRLVRRWSSYYPHLARKCRKRSVKLSTTAGVEEKQEVKTPLRSSNIYTGDKDTEFFEYIEDCRLKKGKKVREYLIKWKNSEKKTWQAENDVGACDLVNWYKAHPSKVKQCELKTLEMYNSKKKKIDPAKIKANDMFIETVQNAIDETFLSQEQPINLLILDGPDLNTTFRLLDEIEPKESIDLIVIPNPNSSHVIRQLYCSDDRLVQTVELYKHSAGEYLESLSSREIEFAAIWLDYTSSFYNLKKHNPQTDIAKVFEKQLLRDQGIFAVTLFWGRGAEEKLNLAFKEIPQFANENGYNLVSLCGLEHTYPCKTHKLSSSYDNGLVSLMIYRAHKI